MDTQSLLPCLGILLMCACVYSGCINKRWRERDHESIKSPFSSVRSDYNFYNMSLSNQPYSNFSKKRTKSEMTRTAHNGKRHKRLRVCVCFVSSWIPCRTRTAIWNGRVPTAWRTRRSCSDGSRPAEAEPCLCMRRARAWSTTMPEQTVHIPSLAASPSSPYLLV